MDYMGRFSLYYNTVKYMKLSQVYHRTKKVICKRLKLNSKIKINSIPKTNITSFTVLELDFDPGFLNRYNINELMNNEFTFLYSKRKIDIAGAWNDRKLQHLWRYNLHYFDFIYPLAKAYKENKDDTIYIKFKELVNAWIDHNIAFTGDGWHPYTLSLRITNWICGYEMFEGKIEGDIEFRDKYIRSIYLQYLYLQRNLEKDVLGNHYFENIKALIIGSVFFGDKHVLNKFVSELVKQLDEQIMNDGMHFELSPMYHKIILEDLIKIAFWLKSSSIEIPKTVMLKLKKMIDCIYSLEKDMGTTPLFNDSGNNIAKSTESLLYASEKYFGLKPDYRTCFDDSGYYIMHYKDKKIIIDCGEVCPSYLPAHGHCDALSYELSIDGMPFIVNSGTYEYEKGEWRDFFRSTRSHNTLMIDDVEQSHYWGSFRVAKRIYNVKGNIARTENTNYFRGSYINQKGSSHERYIFFSCPDILVVLDKVSCKGTKTVKSYVHFHPEFDLKNNGTWEVWKQKQRYAQVHTINSLSEGSLFGERNNGWYAPEFGIKDKNHVLEIQSISDKPYIGYVIDFGEKNSTLQIEENILILVYDDEVQRIDLNKLML